METDIDRIAMKSLEALLEGELPSKVLKNIPEVADNIAIKKMEVVNQILRLTNKCGFHELGQKILDNVPEQFRTEDTRRIEEYLHGAPSPHAGIRRAMFFGNFEEASRLLTAQDTEYGIATECASAMLDAGQPRMAFQAIQRFISDLRPDSRNDGLNISVLTLYAKCAHADSTLATEFIEHVERLRQEGTLPEAYVDRLLYVLRHGKKKTNWKNRHGGGKFRNTESIHPESEIIEAQLPATEGKKNFLEAMHNNDFVRALNIIGQLKQTGTVDAKLYEQHFFRTLSAHVPPQAACEQLLQKATDVPQMLKCLLFTLVVHGQMTRAAELFVRYRDSDISSASMFGDALRQHAKTKTIAAIADHIAPVVEPRVIVLLLKPLFLHSFHNNNPLSPLINRPFFLHLLQDEEMSKAFGAYVRERARTNPRAKEIHILRQLETVYGERAHEIFGRLMHEDSSDELGRVARSQFFADPHTMLRAQPIDRTAYSVATNRSRQQNDR